MEDFKENQLILLLFTHKKVSRKIPTEVYISKNKKPQTLTVRKVITIASSRESMEFSIIRFYGKITNI